MSLSLPVAFAAILFVLTMGLLPIIDPDFFWHVKIGELIRQAGAIPSAEVFSHTANGQPWLIQGWLSDVVLDSVFQSSGIMGIRLLVAVMLILIWLLIYRAVRLYAARPETALLLSIFGVALLAPVVAPRPTMATALGVALTVHGLLAFRRGGELRWLLILPPVFALWPNLHFGYIVGLGMIALFVLGEGLARWLPIAGAHQEPGTLIARGPILIGLFCLIAIGANPHGYGVVPETIRMFFVNSAAQVTEWQTPSFADITGKLVYAAIGAFIIAHAFARKSIHWLDVVVPLAVIAAALSAVRHISLLGIVLMPFIARALANWEPGVLRSRVAVRKGLHSAATRDLGPRATMFANMGLVACVVVGTVLLSPLADQKFGEMRAQYQPSGAADFLIVHDLKGRLFNSYNGGGYLIYRLYPRQLVFIDGRYNPYTGKVLDDFLLISNGKPNWFSTLQGYGIDIVLTETDSPLRQLVLLRPEFRLVYEDRFFSVLVRDIDRFRDLAGVEPSGESGAPR